jgi:hypothetical protein
LRAKPEGSLDKARKAQNRLDDGRPLSSQQGADKSERLKRFKTRNARSLPSPSFEFVPFRVFGVFRCQIPVSQKYTCQSGRSVLVAGECALQQQKQQDRQPRQSQFSAIGTGCRV